MAYCTECGAYFDEAEGVCLSCGGHQPVRTEVSESTNLHDTADEIAIDCEPAKIAEETGITETDTERPAEANWVKADLVEVTSSGAESEVFEDNPAEFQIDQVLVNGEVTPNDTVQSAVFGQEEQVSRNQQQSHLGKGLIKPQVVEIASDGYHFRYDQPEKRTIKSDQAKVVEYRITAEEMELRKMDEIISEKIVQPELGPPTADSGEGLEMEEIVQEGNVLEEQLLSEAADQADSAEPIAGAELPEPETGIFETEVNIDEPLELPEPELALPEGAPQDGTVEIAEELEEIIWQGQGSWLGLPDKKHYQITNKSVAQIGQYGNKAENVEISEVIGVSLKQSWLERILGIGNLVVLAKGDQSGVVMTGIRQPQKVQRIIERLANSIV